MSRLPIPGKDKDTWGEILLDFLSRSHTSSGHEKFPSWENSSKRPIKPFTGMIGANKELNSLEIFNGRSWEEISRKNLREGRLLKDRLEETVSVRDFGAKGDGKTDDTRAFELAFGISRSVFVPPSESPYLISNLKVPGHSTLFGPGKNLGASLKNIEARKNPVLYMKPESNTNTGWERKSTVKGLDILSRNAPCILIHTFHNFEVIDCRITLEGSSSQNAVHCVGSYRALIENSHIEIKGGSGFCFYGMNNVNGNLIQGNYFSGGLLGGALNCGQNQMTEIIGNRISHSLHGIWFGGSDNKPEYGKDEDGSSYSLTIQDNWIEDCSTPIKLGTYRMVTGAIIQNNYIKNKDKLKIQKRTACLTFYRMRNSYIGENIFEAHETEFIYGMNTPSNLDGYNSEHFGENKFISNTVIGSPAKEFGELRPANANFMVESGIGGSSEIERDSWHVYTSPPIRANKGTPILCFEPHRWVFGGKVLKIEVLNVQGSLAGAKLEMGYKDNIFAILREENLGNLNYQNGYYCFDNIKGSLRKKGDESRGLYRVRAGNTNSQGSFQIRITYRAC